MTTPQPAAPEGPEHIDAGFLQQFNPSCPCAKCGVERARLFEKHTHLKVMQVQHWVSRASVAPGQASEPKREEVARPCATHIRCARGIQELPRSLMRTKASGLRQNPCISSQIKTAHCATLFLHKTAQCAV